MNARAAYTMEIFEHMKGTSDTACYPNQMPESADADFAGLCYVALKLAGEAGEVAEKVGKALRDNGGVIDGERRSDLAKEIGDVYWYLGRMCHHLKLDPRDVLQVNRDKLMSRKERGTIQGSGDNR